MWKKIKFYFFIIAFFSMLIVPQLLYKITSNDKSAYNSENRILAEKPDFTLDTIRTYPRLYENYFNDHVAYKSKFIKFNQMANYYLFDIVENDKALLGDNDWLFFKDDYTLEDYQGVCRYTDEQVISIANEIIAVDEYYKSIGIKFVLFIAPNKESIYGENLPDKYAQFEDYTRADQIYKYLEDNSDVLVVSPKERLRELKEEYQLYYKYDTHWNDIGAYVSSNYLLKAMGMEEMSPLKNVNVYNDGEHIGDLATMLNLTSIFYKEPEVQLSEFSSVVVTNVYSKPHSIVFNEKYTSDVENDLKLYIVGDSFSAKLEEYMKYGFAESTVIHRTQYTPGLAESEMSNVVVCEVVERYIDQMANLSSIFIPTENGE